MSFSTRYRYFDANALGVDTVISDRPIPTRRSVPDLKAMFSEDLLFINRVTTCMIENDSMFIAFNPALCAPNFDPSNDGPREVVVAFQITEGDRVIVSPRVWAVPLLIACIDHVVERTLLAWDIEKFKDLYHSIHWGCSLKKAYGRLDNAREVLASVPKTGIPIAIGSCLSNLQERVSDNAFLLRAVQTSWKNDQEKIRKLEKAVKDLQDQVRVVMSRTKGR